jgi:hypothetical protein
LHFSLSLYLLPHRFRCRFLRSLLLNMIHLKEIFYLKLRSGWSLGWVFVE